MPTASIAKAPPPRPSSPSGYLTPSISGDDASSVGSAPASPLSVPPPCRVTLNIPPQSYKIPPQSYKALPPVPATKPTAANDAAGKSSSDGDGSILVPNPLMVSPARPATSLARPMAKPLTSKASLPLTQANTKVKASHPHTRAASPARTATIRARPMAKPPTLSNPSLPRDSFSKASHPHTQAASPARPATSPARPMAKQLTQAKRSLPRDSFPQTSLAPCINRVMNPAISLEGLLHEKKTLLASFEAKFNEKILARHNELMVEQKRSLESKPPEVKDNPLTKKVQKLEDDMEEQKFSHEVELSLQKNMVKKLEEELERKGGRTVNSSPATQLSAQADSRVNKLEDELQQERKLRIVQLKSLEQLHFAEFREIEKKHAEFVSHLVASYQKEIKVLKGEMKAGRNIIKSEAKVSSVSCEQRESSEAAEAAAALSSLAAPSVAEEFNNPPTNAKIDDSSTDSAAVRLAIQMPPTSSVVDNDTKPPLRESDMKEGNKTEGRGKKRNLFAMAKSSSVLTVNISEVSDSGSASGDNEEPQNPAKKVRGKISTKQRDMVEEILRKAGKMPPKEYVPVKKDAKPEKKMLSEQAKEYLKNWMLSPEHCDHPYPTPDEKAAIMVDTGISFTELNNWFVNNRKRFWQNVVKPKIPEIKKAHRMRKMKESYESCNADE